MQTARTLGRTVLLLIGAVAAGGSPATADDLTVVELFTSQGCSSCPPANANFAAISGRPDVLALSFGVTYWNRLGWPDTFAKEAFTDRQVAYEKPLGRRSPFTPQIVVNGSRDTVGNEARPLEALIGRAGRLPGPEITLTGGKARIAAGDPPAGGADIWLVRYDPRTVVVDVRRGENGGRKLPHTHVVHQLRRLGSWSGTALTIDCPGAAGLRTAVLVQARNGGPILAAARD